jgi:hypothetical protein
MGPAISAANFLKNPIFNKIIKPIKDTLMHFIDQVKNFFTGGMIRQIK